MALLSVASMLQTSNLPGESGIVMASDIARYDTESTAEITQGAGAVAMLVENSPKLIDLDLSTVGYYSQDVDDFFRPLGSKTAKVKGRYSMDCYLESLEGAFLDHCRRAGPEPPAGADRQRAGHAAHAVPEHARKRHAAPAGEAPGLHQRAHRGLSPRPGLLPGSGSPVLHRQHLRRLAVPGPGLPAVPSFPGAGRAHRGQTRPAGLLRLRQHHDHPGRPGDAAGSRRCSPPGTWTGPWRRTARPPSRTTTSGPKAPYEAAEHERLNLGRQVPADCFYLASIREDGYRDYRHAAELHDWLPQGEASSDLHRSRPIHS